MEKRVIEGVTILCKRWPDHKSSDELETGGPCYNLSDCSARAIFNR
ncbi:MAG: hypothetical protein BWX81_00491 [Spirochaetes bacterium ADurb.Bin110]|nr:MAG: hypothetical protein BWX81_00491 [Spirochaetes bacterium ADurb.Bin110]